MDKVSLLTFIIMIMLVIVYFIFIGFMIGTITSDIAISRFKKALIRAIKHNAINNVEDVLIIYNGARNIGNSNNHRQSLNKIIKKLIFEKTYSIESKNADVEETLKIIDTLKKILKENENYSPFSDLPIQERMLFEDVSNYLEHDDITAAKNKVNEISNLFVILNEKILKSDRLTKLSVGLAIASTAITIFTLF